MSVPATTTTSAARAGKPKAVLADFTKRPALIERFTRQRDEALRQADVVDEYSAKHLRRYADSMNEQIETVKGMGTNYT